MCPMHGSSPAGAMAPEVAPDANPHPGIGFREFVGMVAAMMALMALGIDTMLPALPDIGRSYGVTHENELQAVVTVFVLGFGVSQLLYGPLSDRFGRRPVMLGGMISYAVFAIGAALAPTFPLLLVMRTLQGVAVAATRVTNQSAVRDCYSGRQMARVMSLAMIVFIAVPILAPSIGQLLMQVAPWRWLFVFLALFGFATFVWVAIRLPETLHPRYRRPISFAAVGQAMMKAVTQRRAIAYMLALGLMQGALLGYINSVQQVFADIFHAPGKMPLVFAISAGGIAIASIVNSRIVERLGMRRVGHTALIGYAVTSLAHIAFLAILPETIASFTAFQVVAMFCFGLTSGNFAAMAMEPLGDMAGTASSVLGFIQMVLGSLIGYLIGQDFDGSTMPLAIGFAGSAVLVVLIVLWAEGGRLCVPHYGR